MFSRTRFGSGAFLAHLRKFDTLRGEHGGPVKFSVRSERAYPRLSLRFFENMESKTLDYTSNLFGLSVFCVRFFDKEAIDHSRDWLRIRSDSVVLAKNF